MIKSIKYHLINLKSLLRGLQGELECRRLVLRRSSEEYHVKEYQVPFEFLIKKRISVIIK